MPSTFFLIRRKGADDDSWEYADQEQVDALDASPAFEVRECVDVDRRGGGGTQERDLVVGGPLPADDESAGEAACSPAPAAATAIDQPTQPQELPAATVLKFVPNKLAGWTLMERGPGGWVIAWATPHGDSAHIGHVPAAPHHLEPSV